MRVLVFALLVCLAQASQGFLGMNLNEISEPMSLIAMEETDTLQGTTECQPGYKCPIVDGVCCGDHVHCCPFNCVMEANKYKCIQSDSALAAQRLAKLSQQKSILKQEQSALAKAEEEKELAMQAKLDREKEMKAFKESLEEKKAKQQHLFNKKRARILKKLKAMAAAAGQKLSKFLPKNFKQDMHKKKMQEVKKLAAMTDDQKRKYNDDKKSRLKPVGLWTNFAAGYDKLRVQRWRDLCMVSGLLRGHKGVIATLPPTCRPKGQLVFTVLKDNQAARVDVKTSGDIELITRTSKPGWVSLAGINFVTKNGTGLFLQNDWTNYGGAYRDSFLRRIGKDSLCVICGLPQHGKWPSIGEVGNKCAPDHNLVFSGNNHDKALRMDVMKNKTIQTITKNHKYHWVSLSGMVYSPRGGETMTLLNRWINHDVAGTYRQANYKRIGNVVTLSGMLKPGQGGHIATLPPGYRPIGKLVFGTNYHSTLSRIDIDSTGKIMYASPGSKKWVTLDGITFYVVRNDQAKHADEENRLDIEEMSKSGAKPILRKPGKSEPKSKSSVATKKMQALKSELKKMTASSKQK